MSTIEQDIAQIREAVYGKDVREAIADGLERCYEGVVRLIAQETTEKEKLQARTNIGIDKISAYGVDYGGTGTNNITVSKTGNLVTINSGANGKSGNYAHFFSTTGDNGLVFTVSAIPSQSFTNEEMYLEAGHSYLFIAEILSGTFSIASSGSSSGAKFELFSIPAEGDQPTQWSDCHTGFSTTINSGEKRHVMFYAPQANEFAALGFRAYYKQAFSNMVVRFTYKDVTDIVDIINATGGSPVALMSMSPTSLNDTNDIPTENPEEEGDVR